MLAKLEQNKKEGKTPANPEQLRLAVGMKKGGINATLKVDGTHFTSTYADDITHLLEIDPPIIETDEDDEHFAKDVLLLRSLTPEARRDLMGTAVHMARRPSR